MTRTKVLVVDDDSKVAKTIGKILEGAGYEVITAFDGQEALKRFYEHKPDMVIADIVMPRMNGFDLIQRIREVSNIPIICITGRAMNPDDKIRGFSLGADDYLSKPFHVRELVARVQAVLRRSRLGPIQEVDGVYTDGTITIDFQQQEVYARGQKVELRPTEFRLLTALVKQAGKPVAESELGSKVGNQKSNAANTLRWHMMNLRRKIEEDRRNPKLVATVRGIGYKYQRGAIT